MYTILYIYIIHIPIYKYNIYVYVLKQVTIVTKPAVGRHIILIKNKIKL